MLLDFSVRGHFLCSKTFGSIDIRPVKRVFVVVKELTISRGGAMQCANAPQLCNAPMRRIALILARYSDISC